MKVDAPSISLEMNFVRESDTSARQIDRRIFAGVCASVKRPIRTSFDRWTRIESPICTAPSIDNAVLRKRLLQFTQHRE